VTLEMITHTHFDLVLMDIQMPFMDGYETTRAIRKLEKKTAEVPIIAMTANAIEGDKEKCLAAGMNDYLSKPIRKNAMVAALKRWVPVPEGTPSHHEAKVKPPKNAESSNKLPAFDAHEAIDRYDGDLDVLKMIVDSFLDDTPHALNEIANAIDSGDTAAAGARSHSLKGGASYIGAKQMQASALALETAGKAGDLNASGKSLRVLKDDFERFKNDIATFSWEKGEYNESSRG
jgi:two-component system, sensor histidine kinase and response regulator